MGCPVIELGVQMKICAKCDAEYADNYDGCPQCAKAVPTTELPPGSLAGATLALLGYFVLSGVFTGASGSATFGAVLSLLAFAIIVSLDANKNIKIKKMPGILGTSALVWTLGVFLLAIVFIPVYFYQRPRIIAAHSPA